MSAHTPGPWSFHSECNALHLSVRAGMLPVAEMWLTGAPMDERKANACLISAAPDLLTVAEELLEYAEMYLGLCDGQDPATELSILTARDVIRKATGAA